jgi:hypothetical protein
MKREDTFLQCPNKTYINPFLIKENEEPNSLWNIYSYFGLLHFLMLFLRFIYSYKCVETAYDAHSQEKEVLAVDPV